MNIASRFASIDKACPDFLTTGCITAISAPPATGVSSLIQSILLGIAEDGTPTGLVDVDNEGCRKFADAVGRAKPDLPMYRSDSNTIESVFADIQHLAADQRCKVIAVDPIGQEPVIAGRLYTLKAMAKEFDLSILIAFRSKRRPAGDVDITRRAGPGIVAEMADVVSLLERTGQFARLRIVKNRHAALPEFPIALSVSESGRFTDPI